MRTLVLALVLTAATGPAVAGAAPLDELNRFAGTWQSQGTFVDTPYQKAGNATATTTCAWSIDGEFMICQQSANLNGTHDSALGIYSYDSTAQAYRFDNVHTARSTSTTVTVDGDTVTYPFTFSDNGKSVTIRTLNVWKSPTMYTWRTEYSTDGGATWSLMGSGVSQKSGAP
jgi:hypothetical protein